MRNKWLMYLVFLVCFPTLALGGVYRFPGGLQVNDGAVGTPSVGFTDDPDTGIYSCGANCLGFSAGGTLRGQFDSSGLDIPAGQTLLSAGTTTLNGTLNGNATANWTGLHTFNGGATVASGQTLKVDGTDGTVEITTPKDANGSYTFGNEFFLAQKGTSGGSALRIYNDETNQLVFFRSSDTSGTSKSLWIGGTSSDIYAKFSPLAIDLLKPVTLPSTTDLTQLTIWPTFGGFTNPTNYVSLAGGGGLLSGRRGNSGIALAINAEHDEYNVDSVTQPTDAAGLGSVAIRLDSGTANRAIYFNTAVPQTTNDSAAWNTFWDTTAGFMTHEAKWSFGRNDTHVTVTQGVIAGASGSFLPTVQIYDAASTGLSTLNITSDSGSDDYAGLFVGSGAGFGLEIYRKGNAARVSYNLTQATNHYFQVQGTDVFTIGGTATTTSATNQGYIKLGESVDDGGTTPAFARKYVTFSWDTNSDSGESAAHGLSAARIKALSCSILDGSALATAIPGRYLNDKVVSVNWDNTSVAVSAYDYDSAATTGLLNDGTVTVRCYVDYEAS